VRTPHPPTDRRADPGHAEKRSSAYSDPGDPELRLPCCPLDVTFQYGVRRSAARAWGAARRSTLDAIEGVRREERPANLTLCPGPIDPAEIEPRGGLNRAPTSLGVDPKSPRTCPVRYGRYPVSDPSCPCCKTHCDDKLPSASVRWGVRECLSCGHAFVVKRQHDAHDDNAHFDAAVYLAWRERHVSRLRAIAHMRARYVQSRMGTARGRVLELGCSTGEMLAEMGRRGWTTYGVDLSPEAIRIAQSRLPASELSVGTETALLPRLAGAFDLILAFHVLEHISELDPVVHNCRALCAPGGHLVLFVPNWNSWSRRVFGDQWPDFMPEHVQFFCRSSLAALLRRHSFRVDDAATGSGSWAWLGGISRKLKAISPHATTAHAGSSRPMPSPFRMRVLHYSDACMRPFLWLEELFRGGNELRIVAVRE
jgi:2-polyprenyl-3-methyl-5-hydroxy-6-metoxy-1,4-benzoquinol methylase